MSDMLNQVDVTIQIAGTTCDYETLTLHQSMYGHHHFEVLVNYKPNKPSLWSTTPETVFEQLGETLDIRMEHKESGELTEFSGLITDIEVGGKDGDQGYALIIGGSPTLLLDRGPSMAAYVDYTIGNLVSEEIENSGLRIDLESKPRFEGILPYAAKYKETTWQFLSRMAALCGEWFYYDGQKLILGNPKREDTTRAAFDLELQQLRIRSKLEQLNTELYDYDPNTDDYKEDAAPESIDGVNSYMRVAKDRSSGIYKEPAKLPAGRAMIDESDIMATTRAHFSRVYSQSSVFEAVSNTCAIRVGELVTTRLPESLQKDCGPDLGRYRVLSITHIVDQKGLYRNKFKGVAGATETLPLPEGFKAPMAFPEPATVTDNADPDKLGRVGVRFFWQDHDAASNWMRVQTPGAGTSAVIEKNRGFWFVTETVNGRTARYSNGFVLIQHEYESPKGQQLTFYSFYNHLLALEEMKGIKIPDIFKGERYKVKATANDSLEANGENGDKGALLRSEAKTGDNIVCLMSPNSSVEIAPESQGKKGWLKVVNYGPDKLEGWCHDTGLEKEAVVILEEKMCDEVKEVCMDVNAGTIVGFAGYNGFENQTAYRAAHVEVFSSDDAIKDFLKNTKKDGENEQKFVKFPKGTEFKTAIPKSVRKDSKVKLLAESTDQYQLVEVENIALWRRD